MFEAARKKRDAEIAKQRLNSPENRIFARTKSRK